MNSVPKKTKTTKKKKTINTKIQFPEYLKVYIRIVYYPGIGWLLLPPRNEMKQTQEDLHYIYTTMGHKESVTVIKELFKGMQDKSESKLVKKYLKEAKINRAYVVVKFHYHPKDNIMEFVGEDI